MNLRKPDRLAGAGLAASAPLAGGMRERAGRTGRGGRKSSARGSRHRARRGPRVRPGGLGLIDHLRNPPSTEVDRTVRSFFVDLAQSRAYCNKNRTERFGQRDV